MASVTRSSSVGRDDVMTVSLTMSPACLSSAVISSGRLSGHTTREKIRSVSVDSNDRSVVGWKGSSILIESDRATGNLGGPSKPMAGPLVNGVEDD
jgi:hypothetical protein